MIKKTAFILLLIFFGYNLYSQGINTLISNPFITWTSYGSGTMLHATATIDNIPVSTNDILVCFVGNEIRNDLSRKLINHQNGSVGESILVHSTIHEEIIEFYLWRYSEQIIYRTTHTETTTIPQGPIGTPQYPVNINFTTPTATVRGLVLYEHNDAPIQGVEIRVISSTLGYENRHFASQISDAQGRYAVIGIPNLSTVTVRPSNTGVAEGFTFYPPNIQRNYLTGAFYSDFYARAPQRFRVHGQVTFNGLGLDRVQIEHDRPESVGVIWTDPDGYYELFIIQNTGISITPRRLGWVFTEPSEYVGMIASDRVINFTANYSETFTVSGSTGVSGVSLNIESQLSGLSNIPYIPGDTYEVTNIIPGDRVIIQPAKAGYTFDEFNELVNSDMVFDFTPSIEQHDISGRVTLNEENFSGVGIYVDGVLRATTGSNGTYSFKEDYGSTITVVPYLRGYKFYPEPPTITVTGNMPGNDFTAETIPEYTVDVYVFEAETNTALTGILITYEIEGSYSDNKLTDDSGIATFFINETENKNIIFTASRAGYTFRNSPQTIPGLYGDLYIEFEADIYKYTLSGQVLNNEMPVGGVEISLTGDINATRTTDSQGLYSFTNLIPHSSNVTITPYRFGLNITPNPHTFPPFIDDIENFDFNSTRETRTITVRTSQQNTNNPVPGIIVSFNSITATHTGSGSTLSNGLYSFTAYRGETYLITVTNNPDNLFEDRSREITITDNETLEFKSRSREQFLLKGKIELYDINNPTVPLDGLAGVEIYDNDRYLGITEPSGDYEITIYEGDELELIPVLEGFNFQFHTGASLPYSIPNVNENHEGIDFKAFRSPFDVRVRVLKGVELQQGVSVFDKGIKIGETDIHGMFIHEVLYEETVDITVFYHEDWESSPPRHDVIINRTTLLEFNLKMIEYEISGRVEYLDGEPVAGVRVYNDDPDNGENNIHVITGADGRFSLEFPIGTTFINIKAHKDYHNIFASPEGSNIIENINDDHELVFFATAFSKTGNPTVSPSGGDYTRELNITIDGEEDAIFYYTLDGSEPTNLSDEYSTPITISKSTIFKTMAQLPGQAPSDVITHVYYIDHLLTLSFTDPLWINMNGQAKIDMKEYILDSVRGNHVYEITLLPPQTDNLEVTFDVNHEVIIKPRHNDWMGTEYLDFEVRFHPDHIDKEPPNDRIHNFAEDTLTVMVYPSDMQRPVEIYNHFPVKLKEEFLLNTYVEFFINIVRQEYVTYQWFVNGELQDEPTSLFGFTFLESDDFEIRVVASDLLSSDSRTWEISVVLSDDEKIEPLYKDALLGNFPNPFNPETTILFSLEEEKEVEISIFNMRGQHIGIITNQRFPSGLNRIVWDAKNHSSGIYLVSLKTNNTVDIKRVILLK